MSDFEKLKCTLREIGIYHTAYALPETTKYFTNGKKHWTIASHKSILINGIRVAYFDESGGYLDDHLSLIRE